MKDFFRRYGGLLALALALGLLLADCAGGYPEGTTGTIQALQMTPATWEHYRATYDKKGRQTRPARTEYHPPHYYVTITFTDDKPTTVVVTRDEYEAAALGRKTHYRCRRGRWSGVRWLETYKTY